MTTYRVNRLRRRYVMREIANGRDWHNGYTLRASYEHQAFFRSFLQCPYCIRYADSWNFADHNLPLP